MPKIFDNLTPESQLGVALRDYFGGSYESLDVATGYLDLRGWGHLGDIIGGKPFAEGDPPVARVLVGMVAPSDSQAILSSLQAELAEQGPARPSTTTARRSIRKSGSCATYERS